LGSGETENTQYGSEDCEDRRGDTTDAALGCPFAFIDIISFITMMKREQSITGLWDYGNNLYQSLYCVSLIRVT
jgi:hypothetical protein